MHLSSPPDLRHYDLILANHSGGKDSTVALRALYDLATAADVADRVVVLHNDLGRRIEWPGTADLDAQYGDYYREVFGATLVEIFGDRPSARDLAAKQAAEYGLPFHVRSRMRDGRQADLLDQILQYGRFPDASARHCTSEQKRAPKHRLLTELVREASLGRKMRILDVNGERAAESAARARKPEMEYNRAASNRTKRDVWTWRIIHHLTLEDVWACHDANGLEWHWVYDAGGSRLSCSICVLGSVGDVTLACLLRPDEAAAYLDVEQRVNHLFRNRRSIEWFMDRAGQMVATGQARAIKDAPRSRRMIEVATQCA